MEYDYDIAFSFSGDDREYVEQVANILRDNGIKVFYDMFEQIDLWGKDLGIHFDFVYRKAAKYCVPFISETYKNKVWTNHEIKTAISRAINSNEEYILPARFDDTEIDGIRPTIGYLDLRNFSPEQLSNAILEKLGNEPSVPIVEKMQDNEGKIYLASNSLFSEYIGFIGASLGVTITNINKEYRYFNEPYFQVSEIFGKGSNTFYLIDKLRPTSFPTKLEYGEVASVDYKLSPNSLEFMWNKLPLDATVHAVVTTTVGERFKSNLVTVENVIKSMSPKI
ncbi:MAG: TIR domain-containing protein [Saprospiraceae bacterium]|nr:TIR domain-containing protein [Saprospiraceae bacterium]